MGGPKSEEEIMMLARGTRRVLLEVNEDDEEFLAEWENVDEGEGEGEGEDEFDELAAFGAALGATSPFVQHDEEGDVLDPQPRSGLLHRTRISSRRLRRVRILPSPSPRSVMMTPNMPRCRV